MSESNAKPMTHPEKRLRNVTDFLEQLQNRDVHEVRDELGVPDVDRIVKELQNKHGIRITLSPKLIERFETLKRKASLINDFPALKYGCPHVDICIFCDRNDFCQLCDVLDWCIGHDTT